MDTALFGDGSIRLDWISVDGRAGLSPQLVLKGRLIAKGYGIGSVVQITAEVTAWEIIGSHALLGTAGPKACVLNWAEQQYVRSNPPPPDEKTWDLELWLPMSPSIVEGLEERRQGKDFALQLDTTLLLVDYGSTTKERPPVHYATYPIITTQDRLGVSQHKWNQVLERWDRGLGIHVLVPLSATEPNPERAVVVRHLMNARRKIDGGDYDGSFAESRKALELLRGMSQASLPLPRSKDRDTPQRIHAVLDALFALASASMHTDPPIKNFVPVRADAVALAAGSAGVAQQVFARLDRS